MENKNLSNASFVLSENEEPPAQRKKIICISEKTKIFKEKFYPEIKDEEWNDWHWQIRNSIITYEELYRIFNISDNLTNVNLPIRITPYYASIITSISSGIGKCVIPTSNELLVTENEFIDSLQENEQSPVKCIVHRYPDRVLFLTTDFCSSNCRYCTRSRLINKEPVSKEQWNKGIEYIKSHPEIRDVLLSGGDPLTMSDNNIDYILSEIRKIKHIEIVRIGTKIPVVLPQRITNKLAKILRKYKVFINIHFTHPDEITPEVEMACDILVDNGIPLGSQTVLLKDVNDNIEIMKKLMHKLLLIRVKPYYIYQCDRVVGTSHFRTSINKGIEIIEGLRGWTSGLCVPHFIIDTPGGKIPLLPDYVVDRSNKYIKLRNYLGKEFIYYED